MARSKKHIHRKPAPKKSFLQKEVDLKIAILLSALLVPAIIILVVLLSQTGTVLFKGGGFGIPDLLPPRLGIQTIPSNPLTVESVSYIATASDNEKVSQVLIYVDNTLMKSCRIDAKSGTCTYSTSYRIGGEHKFYAIATDSSDRVSRYPRKGESSISVREKIGEGASSYYRLTVSKGGAGTGLVKSVPEGISCGSQCSANIYSGAFVSLRAIPDEGFVFDSWADDCSGTDNTCLLTMNSNKLATARFRPAG